MNNITIDKIYVFCYVIALLVFVIPSTLLTSHKLLILVPLLVLSLIKFKHSHTGLVAYDYFLIYTAFSLLWSYSVQVSIVPFFIILLNAVWIRLTISFYLLLGFSRFAIFYKIFSLSVLVVLVIDYLLLFIVNDTFVLTKNHNYNLTLILFLLLPSVNNLHFKKWHVNLFLAIVSCYAIYYRSSGVLVLSFVLTLLSNYKYFINNSITKFFFMLFPFVLYLISIISSMENSHVSRVWQISSSFSYFLLSPFLGNGLDSWLYIDASSNIANPIVNFLLKPVDNHNYPTKVLVELGLLGLIVYGYFIFDVFRKSFRVNNYISQTMFSLLILYFLSINFYYTARSTEIFISGIEILAFTSIGVIICLSRTSS